MTRKINTLWRLFATALAFIVFMVGGLFLTLLIFPCIRLFSKKEDGDTARLTNRAQRTVHQSFRFFFWFMQRLGLLTVEIRGGEKLHLNKPYLILANHPTLLDYVLIVSLLPRVDCIVKQALWHHFFLKGVVQNACYISNQNEVDTLQTCVERLHRGNSVMIFPEGTRSQAGHLRPFQRGAAWVAMRSTCDILPIVLTCTPPTLTKEQRWYEIPPAKPHFRMEVFDPISSHEIIEGSKNDWISARKLTTYLQRFFETKLMVS